MRLSEDVSRAFPRHGDALPEGWVFYLALGIDRLGRGTFLLRPVLVKDAASPAHARRMIEARLLSELRRHLEDTSPIAWAEEPPAQ